MSNVTTTDSFFVPSIGWSRPCAAGASPASLVGLVGAVAYPLSVSATGVAKHAQKRFTMAGTDIDGWPLGPRDGTSG